MHDDDFIPRRLRSEATFSGSLDGIRAPKPVSDKTEKPRRNLEEYSTSTYQAEDEVTAQTATPVAKPVPRLRLNLRASNSADAVAVEPQRRFGRLGHFFSTFKEHKVRRLLQILLVLGAITAVILALRFFFLSGQIITKNTGESALALQSDFDPNILLGEGEGRINVLLIGVDDVGGGLADGIMLVSIDPFATTAAMLSIPRDLVVEIPNFGTAKINAAHAYGEQYNYEGGGPALMKETVALALDIPVHYFVRADFDGFKQAIDTVGGVTVEVEEAIVDHTYPDDRQIGYSPFYIEAGTHVMDGDTALKYARSRYTTSDFDRSRRQREILSALKQRVLALGTFTNPVKINSLMSTMGNNVRTDLQVGEIMKLIEIAQKIDSSQIVGVGLDTSVDNFLVSTNGALGYSLVPRSGDFTEIRGFVRRLLVDGFVREEAAALEVLNGSEREALAAEVAALLESYGYNVVSVANADNTQYTKTVIYDYTNGAKPHTVRYLKERFKATVEVRAPAPDNNHDITVILGSEYTLE